MNTTPLRRPGRPARTLLATAALGALLTGSVLVGCGSGGADHGTADRTTVTKTSDGGADAEGGETAYDESPASALSSDLVTRSDAVSGTDSLTEQAGEETSPIAPELMNRAVISHGTLSLQGKDVDALRRDVQRVVDAQQGSVSEEESDADNQGRTEYVRMVVRVPSKNFSASLKALEATGTVRARGQSSEDVTTQVIDTDVRVRAQQASLKRVEQLLARADSLKDIVWIESQLTERRAELDSLRSQQLWLKDQTSLSTITIDLERATGESTKKPEDHNAFVTGLLDGWDAMKDLGGGAAALVGALLPFLLLGLVLLWPLVLLVRRWRRGATTPLPEPGV